MRIQIGLYFENREIRIFCKMKLKSGGKIVSASVSRPMPIISEDHIIFHNILTPNLSTHSITFENERIPQINILVSPHVERFKYRLIGKVNSKFSDGCKRIVFIDILETE